MENAFQINNLFRFRQCDKFDRARWLTGWPQRAERNAYMQDDT